MSRERNIIIRYFLNVRIGIQSTGCDGIKSNRMLYIYIHTHTHTPLVPCRKLGSSYWVSKAVVDTRAVPLLSVFTSVLCDIFNDDGVCAGRCVVIGVRCLPMVVCGSFSDVGVCAGRCVVRCPVFTDGGLRQSQRRWCMCWKVCGHRCPVFTDGGLRQFRRRWSSSVLLHVHRDRTDYYCIGVCAGRWILRMTMTGSDLRAQ